MVVGLPWPLAARAAFNLEQVAARARELANAPFQEPTRIPGWLLGLSYDQWRDIRFRPERALWHEGKQRFTVQFFHPGLFYDRAVAINVVNAEGVQRVAFSPNQFDYGKNDFASRVPQDLGYAGFRVHYPMNRPEYRDEVIVFLGATYLRAVGKDQGFGLSARGLAIDTAAPSGEEFPYFREFWLVRPSPDAPEMEIYALVDSPRITGAYRFIIAPGEQTAVRVESKLFARDGIMKLGIAPVTSMFFYGENSVRRFEDFHPEVHDSDGLLLAFHTGEWLWRPLDNPSSLQVSAFRMTNPRGFGFLQRDREYDHYQDLETRPEKRPSLWIVPREEWGQGRVELVEIPTSSDANDNVVAFWVPDAQPKGGDQLSFSYDMYWHLSTNERPPGGHAVATRRDRGTHEDAYRFIVDFEGGRLASLSAETVLRGMITVGTGTEMQDELLEQHVIKNPITGGWRLSFQVRPKDDDPLDLRAFLQKGTDTLTETWSYLLVP
ncbi:MAG: glucan biosynthesis protein [Candidatus Binatia bacterium]